MMQTMLIESGSNDASSTEEESTTTVSTWPNSQSYANPLVWIQSPRWSFLSTERAFLRVLD